VADHPGRPPALTGAPIDIDNVHLWLTLDHGAQTLTGTLQSQIKDLADAVVFTVRGDYSATPITA